MRRGSVNTDALSLPVINDEVSRARPMKKYATLFLPLLTSGLLTACATSGSPEVANKPTVIQEQDIQRLAQQGHVRALDARTQQTNKPRALAGVPPLPTHLKKPTPNGSICPPKTAKYPVVAGGKRPARVHQPTVTPPKK